VYDRLVTDFLDQIAFVPAREESLEDVNRLIARSKAYWAWSEEYLSQAIPLHRIGASYLRSSQCFEIITEHCELLGFFSLAEDAGRVVLDNLWIEPKHIGRGIGSRAVRFALERARLRGWPHLWVLPDPPAEGFYRALGFSDTGERIQSRVRGGPVFSVYRISTAEGPTTP
jgi:GNAT superfamily N-acetyltransferase